MRYIQTCPSYKQTCGSTCCELDEICDSNSSTCTKSHKPKSASGSSSEESTSKKLPGKALAGIVTGVVAGVALVVAAVLWVFRGCLGCFGRKKADKTAEQDPPAYDVNDKKLETQVQEVAPEAR